jgi:hypothetical protein
MLPFSLCSLGWKTVICQHYSMSNSATVFLRYLEVSKAFNSAVDFYYVINKLIILVPGPH